MSEIGELDLKEQLARIDRAIEETHKFSEEARKLGTEQLKLSAEQFKLTEEALKLRRDRGLAPWLAVVAISGGVGGIIAGVTAILHLAGKLP